VVCVCVWCVCVCVVCVCGVCGLWCVCVCVGFLLYSEIFLTLTEVFPCFFFSCKANARVKLAKTGHGQLSSRLVVNCVVLF